jgi:hypothetical protein
LIHVRQISKPLRRPIFPDNDKEDIYWSSDHVLAVDDRYLVKWFPQFKRDLNKYQEGHGILLLPVPENQEPYLASGYWNSLKLLSQKYFDNHFDIPTRL